MAPELTVKRIGGGDAAITENIPWWGELHGELDDDGGGGGSFIPRPPTGGTDRGSSGKSGGGVMTTSPRVRSARTSHQHHRASAEPTAASYTTRRVTSARMGVSSSSSSISGAASAGASGHPRRHHDAVGGGPALSGGGIPFPGLDKKTAVALRRHLRGRGAVHGDEQAWRAVEVLEMAPETLLLAYAARMEAARQLNLKDGRGHPQGRNQGQRPHRLRSGLGDPPRDSVVSTTSKSPGTSTTPRGGGRGRDSGRGAHSEHRRRPKTLADAEEDVDAGDDNGENFESGERTRPGDVEGNEAEDGREAASDASDASELDAELADVEAEARTMAEARARSWSEAATISQRDPLEMLERPVSREYGAVATARVNAESSLVAAAAGGGDKALAAVPTLSPPPLVLTSSSARRAHEYVETTTATMPPPTPPPPLGSGSGSAFRAVRSRHLGRGHLDTWPAHSEAAARLERNAAAAALDSPEGTATAYTVTSHAALPSREERAARPKTLVAMEAALEGLREPPPLWATLNFETNEWGHERAREARALWQPGTPLFNAHRAVLRQFAVNFSTYGGVLDRVDRAFAMAAGGCVYEVGLSEARARVAEGARALAEQRFNAVTRRAHNSVEVITKSWRLSLLWVYMMKWREGHGYRRRGRAIVDKMLKRMLEGREPRHSFDKWRRLIAKIKTGRATLGLSNARYRLPDLEAELAGSLRREKELTARLAAARGENDALRNRAEEAEGEVERLKRLLAANLGAKDAERRLAAQRRFTSAAARTALAVGDAALEAAAAACRDAASLPNVHYLVGLASASTVWDAASENVQNFPRPPPPPSKPKLPPAEEDPGAADDDDDDDEEEMKPDEEEEWGGRDEDGVAVAVAVAAAEEADASQAEGDLEAAEAQAVETVTRLSSAAAASAAAASTYFHTTDISSSSSSFLYASSSLGGASSSPVGADAQTLTASEARTAWQRLAMAEGVKRLEELPDDRVLLHWANYHIVRDAAEGGTPEAQRALRAIDAYEEATATAREAVGRAAAARATYDAAAGQGEAAAERQSSVKKMLSLRSLRGSGNGKPPSTTNRTMDEASVAAKAKAEAEEEAAVGKSYEAGALDKLRKAADKAGQAAAKLVAECRVAAAAVARALGPSSVRLAENYDGCWWDGELLGALLRSAAPHSLEGAPGGMLRKTLDPAERRAHCVAALARLGQRPSGECGPSRFCLPTAEELSQVQVQVHAGVEAEEGNRRVQALMAATLAQMFIGGHSGIAGGQVSAATAAATDASLTAARRRWDVAARSLRGMIADAEGEADAATTTASASASARDVVGDETTASSSSTAAAAVSALEGVGEVVLAALAEAEGWRADAVRGHQAYQRLQMRAARFAFDACGAALRKETLSLVNDTEKRSLSNFSRVDVEQIDDFLRERNVGGTKAALEALGAAGSPAREAVEAARAASAEAINCVLREHAVFLRDVFAFYSVSAADMQGGSAGGGSTVTMSNPEFWRFVKDIRVVDGRALISSQVDLIFIAANNDSRSGAPRREEGNSASELLPHEFVEALVRLAVRRFSGSGKSPHECLRQLIVDVVEPRACRSDANQFRAQLVSAPVQAVFARHRRALERVFTHYAALDRTGAHQGKGAGGNTVNHVEFVSMCKDCRLFDNVFTELVAGTVFARVQQSEVDQSGDSVAGGYGEMVFSEFLEAVGALCLYKSPMPHEPLEQRLEHFISTNLLKHAGQKSAPTHARDATPTATATEIAAMRARANALTNARGTVSLLGPSGEETVAAAGGGGRGVGAGMRATRQRR